MYFIVLRLLIFFSASTDAVNGLQADDFYIDDLPLLSEEFSSIRMHAGHLPIYTQHHAALFFWHFASKYTGDKLRTVIWLNGGPGCSSLMGAWMGIGPFRFQNANKIIENNGSWHMFANLLFVEQPVGTGFSYIDKNSSIHELGEMADHFLSFLDRYIEIFPDILQSDIYLAGESFAGQYIPYIAQRIIEKRSAVKLSGLLIGNGWIDPATMYDSYLPFAVANNLVAKKSLLYRNITDQVKKCRDAISKHLHVSEEACNSILRQITYHGAMNNHYAKKKNGRCVNIYDVRLDDTWPGCGSNWPPEGEYLAHYLQRQDVMSRIHLDNRRTQWSKCSDSVYKAFKECQSTPSIKLLPDLLRQIPVMLYSGEYDLICNHCGTEKMLDAMTWNNGTGFDLANGTSAPSESWLVDNERVGLIRGARNLTYILFYNSSHRVPYNYARRSRAMLHQFIKLNLSLYANQTTTKNTIDKTNQARHDGYKRAGFIWLDVLLSIITPTILIYLVVYKKRQTRIHAPFDRTYVLPLHNRNSGSQQLMEYSL